MDVLVQPALPLPSFSPHIHPLFKQAFQGDFMPQKNHVTADIQHESAHSQLLVWSLTILPVCTYSASIFDIHCGTLSCKLLLSSNKSLSYQDPSDRRGRISSPVGRVQFHGEWARWQDYNLGRAGRAGETECTPKSLRLGYGNAVFAR